MQNYFGDKVQTNGLIEDLHNIPTYTRKASQSDRLANYFIDSLASNFIGGMAMVSITVMTAALAEENNAGAAIANLGLSWLAYYGCKIGYYTWFEFGNRGRTLGKLATGTYAVREDSSPLTLKDAFLRSLCRLIPFEVFSGLGDTPWHDSITKTMVIKR